MIRYYIVNDENQVYDGPYPEKRGALIALADLPQSWQTKMRIVEKEDSTVSAGTRTSEPESIEDLPENLT